MTPEQKLLQRSANEIRSLRRQNELMAARLDGFDSALLLLTAQVRQSGQGISPDLAWEIEKHLSEQSKPQS